MILIIKTKFVKINNISYIINSGFVWMYVDNEMVKMLLSKKVDIYHQKFVKTNILYLYIVGALFFEDVLAKFFTFNYSYS